MIVFAIVGRQTHKDTVLVVSGEREVHLRYWLDSLWPSASIDIIYYLVIFNTLLYLSTNPPGSVFVINLVSCYFHPLSPTSLGYGSAALALDLDVGLTDSPLLLKFRPHVGVYPSSDLSYPVQKMGKISDLPGCL